MTTYEVQSSGESHPKVAGFSERGRFGRATMSFQSEIYNFAEALDASTFQAISPGIGLGAVKSIRRPMAPRSVAVPAAGDGHPKVYAKNGPTYLDEPSDMVLKQRPSPAARTQPHALPRRAATAWYLVAWSFDFLIVLSCLAVALAAPSLLFIYQKGMPGPLASLPLFVWLRSIGPLKVLVAVYSVFFGYGIIFRVFAGRTIGESMFRLVGKATSHVTRQNEGKSP